MAAFRELVEGTPCTYCSAGATHWDHVIPRSLFRPDGPAFRHGDWIVEACAECNGALCDRMLHSVPLRAKWLYHRYRRKYRKLLGNATWTADELDELSGSLKILVADTIVAQAELDLRLAHLLKVSAMSHDYLMPLTPPNGLELATAVSSNDDWVAPDATRRLVREKSYGARRKLHRTH